MKKLITLSISSLLILFSHASAGKDISVDAVVIIDSSGSMKKSDPDSLRKPAAKLFISLLNEVDRASIMSFSDNGYPITYLNTLDSDKNIQLTLDATDKVSTKGVYTNIFAAVERAHKILTENPSDRDKIIILLSDGKMDVGDENKSGTLSARLIDETVPKLLESNIKVYSIAFTENSDQALLTTLSESTQGFCKVAENDKELHLAFTSIFEQSKQPDMLPLTENSFLADESIKEITIVANKESIESKILLQDPEGNRFDASIINEQIKWFISDTFDMITIKKPMPGEWKILFSDDDNKAYIVADMSMKSSFDFISENDIEKIQAKAWLEKDDIIVTEEKILDSIEASTELVSPSDQTATPPTGLILNDESLHGVFVSNYTPNESGTYFATITLKSQTFERQKTFSFVSTYAPPITEEPTIEEPPVDEPKTEPPLDPIKEDEEPISDKVEDENISEDTEEDDTLQSILIFLAINIIIVIIGLSVFLFLKYKKQKKIQIEAEAE